MCMVNGIIEELLELDMEPKPATLWWTSTHKHDDMRILRLICMVNDTVEELLDLDMEPKPESLCGQALANARI